MADILKLHPLRLAHIVQCKATDVIFEALKSAGNTRQQVIEHPAYEEAVNLETLAANAFHRELVAVQQCSPANLTADGFVRPTYREHCATRRAYNFSVSTFEEWCNWQRFNGNFNPIEG